MNLKKWIVAVLGCLLVFGALAAWKYLDISAAIAKGKAYPEQSETVEAVLVSTADFTPTISVMGEIVAPQRLDLHNEFAGTITAVNFHSGDRVHAGQLLVQLDVAVEKANLEAARAKAEVARLTYDRILKLIETKVATQNELDKAKADLTSALSDITVLERTIDKKTLRSPFNGRAGLHNFEVGQFLAANTLVASLIGDTSNMWVDFQMPQFYPQLPPGTELRLVAIGNNSAATHVKASVIAENTVLNANNRSRSYRASIPNDSQRYIPYTVVQLAVPIAAPESLLQVPAIAIQNDPLGQYVFTLRKDAAGKGYRAARQQVQVKLMDTDRALIDSGSALKKGDLIAGAGAFKLYQGILVFTRDRNAANGKGPDAAGAVKADSVNP
jgi:RND family efflux transporter MFP subunit